MNTDKNPLLNDLKAIGFGALLFFFAMFLTTLTSCSPKWHVGDPHKKQKLKNWSDEKKVKKFQKTEKKSTQRF